MPEAANTRKRKSTKQVLLEAADLIETKGWTRNWYTYHGRYCVYGAILKVNDHKVPPVAERLIERVLGVKEPTDIGNLALWNDEQAKNKREVVAVLRKAAEMARG